MDAWCFSSESVKKYYDLNFQSFFLPHITRIIVLYCYGKLAQFFLYNVEIVREHMIIAVYSAADFNCGAAMELCHIEVTPY